MTQLGFIGFGEAGFHIAKGLWEATGVRVFAFDVNTHAPRRGELIQQRVSESKATLVETLQALTQTCDVLLSVVTAHSAVQAATACAPFLGAHHIFADLNSVSPSTKRQIAQQILPSGAHFVEVAVMAPVPPYGHRVPMLLNGPSAQTLYAQLAPLGMKLDVMDAQMGAAAATKLCRSIVVKGLEALLFECVLAASCFGAEERVFASLDESFPNMDWQRLASYMIGRVVVHGERRAHEMDEVAAMLRENDIEPMMAEAIANRQRWSAQMGLPAQFGPDGPNHFREVIAALKHEC
jgi:3-hydroxyisobutyrate dehydrogenase-like beta-hydroxyacid dehydrogenase